MNRYWLPYLCLAFTLPAECQTLTRQNLSAILGFENGRAGAFPAGWSGGPSSDIFTDDQVVHSGKYSARIERTGSSAGTFSTLTATIPLDFAGKTIEWRGFIKTQDVSNAVAIWIREDGNAVGSSVAFATSQGLNVNGTTDWKQYSITVPVLPEGKQLFFGFLVVGTGKGWVDDLEMLVDGQPVASAPNRVSTPFDTDHQFDNGSGITLDSLSPIQIGNLAKLAKIWGFLKYHHPAVTAGSHHWDYDLFRVLPQVLAAADNGAANSAISSWIAGLGPVPQCGPCATFKTDDLALGLNIDWISDQSALGASLSQILQAVYQDRSPASSQFFVSLLPNVGNPSFDHELSYPGLKLPDAGYQLLALFRFWNMVEYFYPNRDVMTDDPAKPPGYWDSVLLASIPGVALATSSLAYQQEMMRFIGMIHDTHANLWSSLAARPPFGSCQLPVDLRFVEGLPLVLRYNSKTAGPASGLMPGDVLERLDGVAVNDLVNRWSPLYADSNQAARLRDIALSMTQGPCGSASVVVRRSGASLSLTPNRVPVSTLDFSASYTHDLPGNTFQLLSKDIAYLKLSSVRAADSASYVQSAAGTKGLIIDIRNYPSEFVVFTLGSLLISQPVDFVRFTQGDVVNPGAFHRTPPLQITPQQPHYAGKVVILVDEETQSSAEYHSLAFRAAPGALVIGSTTAGADGNVSTIPLPGALSSYLSGIGIFYPDNRPTQRVGIIPDIEVKPTILGLQAGRDELIEEAIRQIMGASSTLPFISKVANAEGENPAIGSNTWVEIKGSNLAPAASRTWQDSDFLNGNMPTQLNGVSVTVNGKSAYVYYVSPTQVNILTPPDSITGPVQVVVSNNGSISAAYTAQAQALSPSFFVASGPYVLAQHADASLLGPASLSVPGYAFTPAKPGETVVLYANGFGATSTPLISGSRSQSGTLSPQPLITIGGITATVAFAGLVSPGLFQFNVVVPPGIPEGDQSIIATYAGSTTQTGLLLTVTH